MVLNFRLNGPRFSDYFERIGYFSYYFDWGDDVAAPFWVF